MLKVLFPVKLSMMAGAASSSTFSIALQLSMFLLLILSISLEGVEGREISRVIDGFATNITKIGDESGGMEFIPVLRPHYLHQIKKYDGMKCFPKILCTMAKADVARHLGRVDLNGLANGYLRLLSAFPGGPRLSQITFKNDMPAEDESFSGMSKDEFAQNIQDQFAKIIQHIQNEQEEQELLQDEEESALNSDEVAESTKKRDNKVANGGKKGGVDEDEDDGTAGPEMLLTDPLLHQKEKLEMKRLMDELLEEDKLTYKAPASWAETAMTLPIKLPMKLGGAILKNVIWPYLMDRKRRDLGDREVNQSPTGVKQNPRRINSSSRGRMGKFYKKKLDESPKQDPLNRATLLWKKLVDVKQCGYLYPSCPFEAWEVVSMIKLVGMNQKGNAGSGGK